MPVYRQCGHMIYLFSTLQDTNKNDYRLSRNFYKGVKGDAINIILEAVAYNYKRAMRILL